LNEESLNERTIADHKTGTDQATPDASTIDELCVITIRTLAMDAVQRAGSGHPGTAMALAPLAYVLWTRHMKHNPGNPRWMDRDRFILSAGHAAILQYAALHLSGYDISLEQLKRYRTQGSITPGHPENHVTPGVETTTGPLGQGVMNSVGMAIAEAHLGAVFNRPGHEVVDHHTYAICSDGDIMEGASHEAASIAGHLGLGKLIWIYDDNRITIDGDTNLTFSEDIEGRFRSYGWHVQNVGDRANDLDALDRALDAARDERERPSLVVVRTHIAWGAPNLQDTPESHGSPLGDEEIRLTKEAYGWPPDESFRVPDAVREHMRATVELGARREAEWTGRFSAYREAHPELAASLEQRWAGGPPDGWDQDIPTFQPGDGPIATRAASGKVLNGFADHLPWLMGGSADLTGSNNCRIDSSTPFGPGAYAGRNLHWGIREHVMCGASNGMALHGGIRPFAATFFVFTDYARPSIRLAALMGLPTIYIMTHDSIGLGADGPTHQPIEHLASLRAMPTLHVIRPSDANEVAEAWRAAVERTDGPTVLVLSRQKLPIADRTLHGAARGLRRGAYVLSAERGEAADVVLLASGSEVHLALGATEQLAAQGVDARVVSMPCWELFREQPAEYRDSVLPPTVTARVAIEAGATMGWREWVGDAGAIMGIDRFGASASSEDNFREYGLTVEAIVAHATEVLS
jgi:transketolase